MERLAGVKDFAMGRTVPWTLQSSITFQIWHLPLKYEDSHTYTYLKMESLLEEKFMNS